ncbi:hypothetical protein [Planktotalea sp.]|uniref:hypothetical protein n=1 Tax=Planktotalea sp. TaxID=2029877 RepID=UPI003298120A
MLGFGAFALSGCARLRAGNVPVVQEGFVVQPEPVAQDNMTGFLAEGDTIYISGSINADTVAGFEAVRSSNPDANKLVFLEADGPVGSDAAFGFARAVRAAEFSTHLRNDSTISGGAVDAFLGGTQRTMEEGATIGALRGADAEAHAGFVTEMTGGDAYARFAGKFGGRRRPRPMTIAEIGAMGIVSANTGEVIIAN